MNPRLMIIEGPDAVGKTTLALFLAKYFDGVFLHCTASQALCTAMNDYHLSIMTSAETNIIKLHRPVVIDRFWPSELCYGKVLRPGNPYYYNWGLMEEKVTKLGGIYVFCDSKTALERHKKQVDADHPYSDDIYIAIRAQYHSLLSALHQRQDVMQYSIEKHGEHLHIFAETIRQRAKQLSHTAV